MRTISGHWPSDAPIDDRVSRCDICGVPWRRSLMQRNGDGLLVCPNDVGPSVRDLTEANLAAIPEPPQEHPDGGPAFVWTRITTPTDTITCSYRDAGTTPTLDSWIVSTF